MSTKDLCELDAVTLRRMIGRKEVSPVELTDACIAPDRSRRRYASTPW